MDFQQFHYHEDGTSPKGVLGTGTGVHWLGLDCDSLPSLALCWEQEALTLPVFPAVCPTPDRSVHVAALHPQSPSSCSQHFKALVDKNAR